MTVPPRCLPADPKAGCGWRRCRSCLSEIDRMNSIIQKVSRSGRGRREEELACVMSLRPLRLCVTHFLEMALSCFTRGRSKVSQGCLKFGDMSGG